LPLKTAATRHVRRSASAKPDHCDRIVNIGETPSEVARRDPTVSDLQLAAEEARNALATTDARSPWETYPQLLADRS
jgi:hypothetical protein